MNKCFEKKRVDLVVSLCDQMLRKNPNNQDALEYRGIAFTKLGQQECARKDFGRLIATDPTDAYSYYRRSQMFKRFGQYGQAFEDISRAISKHSTSGLLYETRGSILMDLDCPQLALDDLNRAIGLRPKGGTTYFTRSKIEAMLGRTAESQRDLAIALERKTCFEECDFYKE